MYHEPRSFLSLTDISEALTFFQLFKATPQQEGHLGLFPFQSAILFCQT
jgi:hypothetical protein